MKVPLPEMLIAGPAGANTLCLKEPLGGGAFGDVFRAVEESTGTPYAVKFPRVMLSGTSELTAFQNEVLAAKEIRHPNVVQVVHVETNPTDLPPYLVMEFVEGGTLKSRLDKLRESSGLVPLSTIRVWINALIEGIAAINEKMLHRDLKPDNILMDNDTPKISDFGLSKIVGAATRSKTFKGGQHVLYMAPEGWRLDTNEIQIDMYAMGIVLYEIASLEYPYEMPSNLLDFETLRDMHLYCQPRSLHELRPELPIGFCHVVTRLLEKRPQDRFPNWSQVKEALERAWSLRHPEETDTGGPIASLLRKTAEVHEVHAKRRAEQAKRTTEREQQRRLDEFQRGRLLAVIEKVVSDFNEHSSLGKIEIRHAGTAIVYRPPFGGALRLQFLWIDPPLNLKKGQVRFAAYLADSAGPRLNYLLCRSDASDLYGEWVACRVSYHTLFHPEKRRRKIQPFGFDKPEDMHEIERAEQAIHTYVIRFSDDVGNAFLDVVSGEIDRSGKATNAGVAG